MKRLVLLLALALFLGGCASWDEPDVLDLKDEWEDYQPILPEIPETEPAPDYPAAFSLPYHRDHTLDPVDCGEGMQETAASLLYEPLFRLDRTFQPEPLLCGSWEWNETGLICTLNLREGITFSDGSPLTARDVVETLLRAKESERYAYRLRNVAGVSANRAGQVLITLASPNQGLPSLLDIPIVKRSTSSAPVPTGTGPYIFVSDGGGDYLQAREDWWQGKTLPVQTIPLVHAKDRETASFLFSSRRIELLTVDPTGDPSLVTGKSETASQPTSILQFIGFNTEEGRLFSSATLRSLFSQSIDRETLVHTQLVQFALAAQFPISPLSDLCPSDLAKPYDKDAALAALRLAGQDTGQYRELKLLISAGDAFRATSARFIAEQLSVLDWRIEVVELPFEEYLAALEAGDFDLYFGEIRLTADWDLTDLLSSDGPLNYGGYANEATDQLLQEFSAASDRPAAARHLLAHLQSTAPIAPICFKNYCVLTHPGTAEGVSPAPSGVFYGLEDWKIHLQAELAE